MVIQVLRDFSLLVLLYSEVEREHHVPSVTMYQSTRSHVLTFQHHQPNKLTRCRTQSNVYPLFTHLQHEVSGVE